ncbi:helix-turn-helix domain-containing protein [Ferrimicrobium sp.]|uniref:helix-turn-helix domain-containing protein n=2 Tax=Ferrimicrobium sp. TaxID=2926050 RepID=UPI0026141F55|nr:helix-turn-helix domain-containing protein [Ferrimicrobium sp.]
MYLAHSVPPDTKYSLAKAQVIYELAQAETANLGHLRQRLGLDPSCLSRILGRFKPDALVDTATPAKTQ